MKLDELERVDRRLPGFCSCGLQMIVQRSGLMCSNCDFPHRGRTPRDVAFDAVWRKRMRVLYPSGGGPA